MSVKEMRNASGLTQKAFAEALQIPEKTIKNWEQGQRKCPEYLLRLMGYFLEKEGLLKTNE